jgi:hypothetical protein
VVVRLLLFLVISTLLALGSGSGTLALDTTSASTTVWRGEREVDVFLGIKSDDEGGHVDDLFANT